MPKRSDNGKWLTVQYQPVSLFSLKRSDATSMAARSNLVPTPYAIKMALLKVILEAQKPKRLENFESWINLEFNWIRDLQIYVLPPERLIVNRNGYKLRYWNQQADKDYRKAHAKAAPPILPMQEGFVFREWVHLVGNLTLCCGATDRIDDLIQLFSQINYFGKRGCFFQFLPEATCESDLPDIVPSMMDGFTMQPMDDLGHQATFNRINPYSTEKVRLGSDRLLTNGFLPLTLIASSAHYDFYLRSSID
jgi:hypothetical protein